MKTHLRNLVFAFLFGLPFSSSGQQSVVLATSTNGCSAIAIDNTYLYWAAGNAIHKVPKAGGPDANLASITNGVSAITTFGNHIYWAESVYQGYGSIRMMPISGGTISTIVSNNTMGSFHSHPTGFEKKLEHFA